MDYIIIGAGPAGLQLGHLLQKHGRDFLLLEAGKSPGTFFQTYPRHRTLISINKLYTGQDDSEVSLRMDWNSLLCDDEKLLFREFSPKYFPPADKLVDYLEHFAARYQLPIVYNSRVKNVTRGQNGFFEVETSSGQTYQSKRLIVATGVSLPHIPEIPGIENADQYAAVSVNPQDFKNARVLIIGKGNSAFETADNLMETAATIHVAGPKSLNLAWKTHYVGHLRAVNNNFLDTYQLKSQNALIDGNIEKIVKHDGGYSVTISFVRANEVKKVMHYDRVICCTGFRFDASIFAASCRPDLTHGGRFPKQTSAWESTNVPDLFFAGTLMQTNTFKKSTTGFIHGFRYTVKSLFHALEARYQDLEWPATTLECSPKSMMEMTLTRVNRSSALWQQFAYMCDVLVVHDDKCQYYEELACDYIRDSAFSKYASYFVVTLEYGPDHDKFDPFDVSVRRISQDDAMHSDEGHYLHPVVRHYQAGQLVATHHITENLENDWTSELTHKQPLQAFFARELSRPLASKNGGQHVGYRPRNASESGLFA